MEAFLLLAVFIVALTLLAIYITKQNETAKVQITKIVQQAGGSNITIESYPKHGGNRALSFKVSYVDINGDLQTRYVITHFDFLGFLTGAHYWDKPLQEQEATVDNTKLTSKEQIISDMDAEIKRLQEELSRTKNESE